MSPSRLVEKRDVRFLAGCCRIDDLQMPQIVRGHVTDAPLPLNRSAQVLVVAEHEPAVLGGLNVELNRLGSALRARTHRIKRIFRRKQTAAAVHDKSGIGPKRKIRGHGFSLAGNERVTL